MTERKLRPIYPEFDAVYEEVEIPIVAPCKRAAVVVSTGVLRAWRWINWEAIGTIAALLAIGGFVIACLHGIANGHPVRGLAGLGVLLAFACASNKKLSDAQMEQMRAIRESDATREEKRSQMQSILSDEQRSMMEEHRARKREMRQQRGGYPESDETT